MTDTEEQMTNEPFGKIEKKSSTPLWVSFVIGSFILSFIGTFLFVLYVEQPTLEGDGGDALSDSLIVADSSQADSTAMISEKIVMRDSIRALQDSLRMLISGLKIANNTNEDETDEERIVDYRQLAKIYSQMDAKSAAKIITKLEDAMVVGILDKMRDRNAAELLAVIERGRAAKLSEKLSKLQEVN